MSTLIITLLGFLHFFTSLALGSKCPQDTISKLIFCYYQGEISLQNFNVCNCTHIVFTNAVTRVENNTISITEDTVKYLEIIKDMKENLSSIFTLEVNPYDAARILKSENKSEGLINGILDFLQGFRFDGVEINFKFRSDDGVSKESFSIFVKLLSKTLSSHHRRIKREGYDVFEKLDDITTAAYTTQTPKNSTSKTHSIKQSTKKRKKNNRKIREKSEKLDNVDNPTLEETTNAEFSLEASEKQNTLSDIEDNDAFERRKFQLFVRLAIKPEIVAKKYDLKALSKYADILTVPTHDITNSNEEHLTYHPSRLMGLADILNTDSIMDFLTGMGGVKSKMVLSLPATVLKFDLKDENKNTPRAPAMSKPQVINQSQLCQLFSKNNWTVERDDDLTAPYAFSGKTWLAFEDEISVSIKGKYFLLRDFAGGAIYPIDADLSDGSCANRSGPNGYLTGALRRNFEILERKPRALILGSLQEEIHDTRHVSLEAGVKFSEFRIVRFVDHTGAVHVIRKNTKTQFECSRQGYFSHPLGCNKFYRCVKFDQYSDEFTVFEYDCPGGLAFDERWEVCVWPGSLPHGAPCTGSSEIAPVPRSHYKCPNREGYFADPENCRWFFACLDHARDGITPLTAYEFRCPFGLVFSEEKLACDWPWLVGTCGNQGASGYLNVEEDGQSQRVHSITFINGGNLETSLGQYGNNEASFSNVGRKFASAELNTKGSYEGAQSAGFGYIANQYQDNNNRAPFASFSDYEISGGRIFNNEGVILDQNIAGVSSNAAAGAGRVKTLGSIKGDAKSFGRDARFNQEPVQFEDFHGRVGITVKPSAEILKENNPEKSGHFSVNQIQLQNPISTPKPFQIRIPSQQINPRYLENLKTTPSTPESIPFTATSYKTEQINIKQQHLTPQDFSIKKSIVSVNVPVVTPATAIHASGSFLSDSSYSLKPVTRTNFYNSDLKTETHKFEQSDLKNRLLTRVSLNSTAVPIKAPVPTATHIFDYNLGSETKSAVTPPTKFQQTEAPIFLNTFGSQATGFHETSVVDFPQQNHAFGKQSGLGRANEKFEISVVVPAVKSQTYKNLNAGELLLSKNPVAEQAQAPFDAPLATATPLPKAEVHWSGFFSLPQQQTIIDKKISEELRLNSPLKTQNSFTISSVTPETGLFFKAASEQENFNNSAVSRELSKVFPKQDFQSYSQTAQGAVGITHRGEAAVSYGFPVVTQKPNLKFYEERTNSEREIPVVPASLPELTTDTGAGLFQTGSTGVSKLFSNVAYISTPPSEISTLEQRQKISQEREMTYSIPVLQPETNTDGFVSSVGAYHGFLQSKVFKPAYDQQYSIKHSENRFGLFGAVGSTSSPNILKLEGSLPKIQQTEVSIEQQPIVSIDTLSPVDHEVPTLQPFRQSPKVNYNIIKSNYNQREFVTTPAPVVSITPTISTISEPPPLYSLNVPAEFPQVIALKKQQQPNSMPFETSRPTHQEALINASHINFVEKSSNVEQEIKPFTYITRVTTSAPVTYQKVFSSNIGEKSNVYVKSSTYSPLITPAVETFGSTIQQTPLNSTMMLHFRNEAQLQYKPIVHQPSEFFKSNPLTEEKRIQFVQIQAPVQVSTVTPEFEQQVKIEDPVVSTSRPLIPREKLIDLEIMKSVEVSPPFFRSSSRYFSGDTLGKSIDIQQQPLLLVSQKTYPVKQVVQPFYRQQKEETPGNSYQEQFPFQHQVNVKTSQTASVQLKQNTPLPHLSSTAQFSKAVTSEQPVSFFEKLDNLDPALSVFEASKVHTTNQKEIFRTKGSDDLTSPVQTVFDSQYKGVQFQEKVVSKENLLLPITTTISQTVNPQTDKFSAYGSYEFQKVNKQSNPLEQNALIQPETNSNLKPYSVLDVSGYILQNNQNLTLGIGDSVIKSGIKYAINPNIAIPEPSREYLLAQSGLYSAVPGSPTTSRTHYQFQSTTESSGNGFKDSTYFPPVMPFRKKPSKATVISFHKQDDEEVRNDNIQELIDIYSGKFGQVINGKNEKVGTKTFKGNSKGEIEIGSQSLSTVQYDVRNTTPRLKGRGRQAGINLRIQAANKYEEYEIDGSEESQRSFDKGVEASTSPSKTTLDIKNLKLEKDKKTIIVVSQVSDANPIIIGKLAGQCSCQSNKLELRSKSKKSGRSRTESINSLQRPGISNKYLPPYDTDKTAAAATLETHIQSKGTASTPEAAVIADSDANKVITSYSTEQNYVSSSTTTDHPDLLSSTILSSLGPDGVLSITPKTIFVNDKLGNNKKQFRGKTRYHPPLSILPEDGSSVPVLSAVPASEIVRTFDYSVLTGEESRSQNEIDKGKHFDAAKIAAGAAFDRYGPGGWRGFDETLQGSVDCKRPGLFRHPKYCNKFYACNYDPWKERYTLHVFNCPIHLTYDSSISACNWPVRGPACADDNLLV